MQETIEYHDNDIILNFENFFDKDKFIESIDCMFQKFRINCDKKIIENQ